MAERYEVVARVVSQKGTCSAEHKVGQEFTVSGNLASGLCSWAFYTMFPFISALQLGGSFSWEEDPNKTTVACPDATNPVVFELRRVPK